MSQFIFIQGRKKALDTLVCQHGPEEFESGQFALRSLFLHYRIYYLPPLIHATRLHLPRIKAVDIKHNVSSTLLVTVQLQHVDTALSCILGERLKQCSYG